MFGFDLLTRKRTRNRECQTHRNREDCPKSPTGLTLADIAPGGFAKIVGFCPHLSPDRKAHLLAYGMAPGYCVHVLQHSPVTVVQVEHTELAMEVELACEIQVEDVGVRLAAPLR